MPRPNILYLHSHDTGRYIQPYGHAVPTPHLQRLAEQGVVFRQAFCVSPSCSASRSGLLTGQSAHSSGMLGLAHRGFSLRDPREHLAHWLADHGWHTALAGVQHETTAARVPELGYAEVLPTRGGAVAEVAPAAAAWLAAASDATAPREPFFLAVGFSETHRAFPEVDPAHARWARPPAPLPDTARTRLDMACFIESARRLDDGVGQVLAALDAAGLADNTLVLCTTDHGVAFPSMKANLTHHGTGVMLMLRGPGGFAGGRVTDALVSQIDVYPTVCELAGLERPPWLQGRSLLPLVRGEAEQVNEAVFTEVTFHAAYEPLRSVRTPRYSYVRRYDGRTTPVLPNCDDSLSKDELLAAGWRTRGIVGEALHDLVFDPHETHNVAADPAYAAVLDDLRARLAHWMRATDDPLLAGPVAPPPGAQVNDPDGLSPGEAVRVVG